MKKLPLSRSLGYFLDHLDHTAAALVADDDVADLAESFEGAIGEFDAVSANERRARRAVVRAGAVVKVRDVTLDTTTKKVAGYALAEADNDRNSPKFVRYFKTAPSAFISRGLRQQCEATRDTLLVELNKAPEGSPLRAFVEPLTAQYKAALTALTARSKARGERGIVRADIDEWKEGINKLRTTTYAELTKRGAENGKGRDWVESFFRSDDADREDDVGDGGGEPEPV